MSIKSTRDANRKLAAEQEAIGQVAFIEETRQGLQGDPWAWFKSGRALLRSAAMIIEPAAQGTDRYTSLLDTETSGPMSADMRSALDDAHLWPIAQMLLGMGLECLFKCLITEQRLRAPGGKQGHDLTVLAKLAGLSFSQAALDLLEELTIMNQLGRYPAHSDKYVMSTFGMGIDEVALNEIVTAIGQKEP
jgi:hypothetical protein